MLAWTSGGMPTRVLSSEEIQFRSINIDILLSPTEFALGPLVRQTHAGFDIYTPEAVIFGG